MASREDIEKRVKEMEANSSVQTGEGLPEPIKAWLQEMQVSFAYGAELMQPSTDDEDTETWDGVVSYLYFMVASFVTLPRPDAVTTATLISRFAGILADAIEGGEAFEQAFPAEASDRH